MIKNDKHMIKKNDFFITEITKFRRISKKQEKMACPFRDQTCRDSKMLKILFDVSKKNHVPVIHLLRQIQRDGHFTERAVCHIVSVLDEGIECNDRRCPLNKFATKYCGVITIAKDVKGNTIDPAFSAMIDKIFLDFKNSQPKLIVNGEEIQLASINTPTNYRFSNCCWCDWVTDDSVRSVLYRNESDKSDESGEQRDASEMLQKIYECNRNIFDGYAFLSISTIQSERQCVKQISDRTLYRKLTDGSIVPEQFIVMVHLGSSSKSGHWVFYKSAN